jgi:hypothetical protein
MSFLLKGKLQDVMDSDNVERLRKLLKENEEVLDIYYYPTPSLNWKVNLSMDIYMWLILMTFNRDSHLWNIVLGLNISLVLRNF